MWIVLIGLLLYLSFSKNLILFIINITLGTVLLFTTTNLMSDNIEYLYMLSSITFVLFQFNRYNVSGRYYIDIKLLLDCIMYILVSTTIDYNWIFSFPIIFDILQLVLIRY